MLPAFILLSLLPYLRKPGLDLFTMFNSAAIATMDATMDAAKNSQQPWLQASPIRGIFNFNTITASTAPAAVQSRDDVISSGASLRYIQSAHKQLDVRDYAAAEFLSPRRSVRILEPHCPIATGVTCGRCREMIW